MRQSEYEIHENIMVIDLKRLLNRKGVEGWRCSQIIKQDRDYWIVIFEREK